MRLSRQGRYYCCKTGSTDFLVPHLIQHVCFPTLWSLFWPTIQSMRTALEAFLPRAAAALMSSVYEDHKDEDGFLYITYSGENTFG